MVCGVEVRHFLFTESVNRLISIFDLDLFDLPLQINGLPQRLTINQMGSTPAHGYQPGHQTENNRLNGLANR
jgi:hypothetical protein